MNICLKIPSPDSLLPEQKTAEQLQALLNLPSCSPDTQTPLTLGWQKDRLSLFTDPKTAINIDFTAGKLRHRLKFGGGKGQPLAKAIGFHKYQNFSIIDATAGLAGDSFVFASLLAQGQHQGSVTLIERHPVIAALIEDALIRAKTFIQNAPANNQMLAEIIQRMQLHCDHAAERIPTLPPAEVIYLDPMFPEKKKKAAVKKGMQALQQLVGPDQDSEQLLTTALQAATKRVVVKRPKAAPPLIGHPPTTAIHSPNTRYDLYIT